MKKRTKILLIVFGLMIILLFPVKQMYKDGGTTTYTSILYKVIKWKTLDGKTDIDFYIFPFNFKSLDSYKKTDNDSGSGVTQADYLFSFKNQYIGDNSATSRLLEALEISKLGNFTFELKTDKKPYALKINFNNYNVDPTTQEYQRKMRLYSIILLALIDNLDEVYYYDPNLNYFGFDNVATVNVSELNDKYEDIKEYGKSADKLQSLLILINYYE